MKKTSPPLFSVSVPRVLVSFEPSVLLSVFDLSSGFSPSVLICPERTFSAESFRSFLQSPTSDLSSELLWLGPGRAPVGGPVSFPPPELAVPAAAGRRRAAARVAAALAVGPVQGSGQAGFRHGDAGGDLPEDVVDPLDGPGRND